MSNDSPPAVEHALALAYAYLNRRDRTVAEVREHLQKRGIQASVADAAVTELRDQGYLDDDRFARLFAQDKGNLEQWGSDRIRRALIGRGVPEQVTDALRGADAESGELERAVALLERRFPAGLSDRRDSQRALGVLLRKGYDYDLSTEALSQHRRRISDAA